MIENKPKIKPDLVRAKGCRLRTKFLMFRSERVTNASALILSHQVRRRKNNKLC